MRDFFRFILPLLIIVLAIALVAVGTAINKPNRPDRAADAPVVTVDGVPIIRE